MSYKCNTCETEWDNTNSSLGIETRCPEGCGGRIIFEGWCRDCEEKMVLKDDKRIYTCSNCHTKQDFNKILKVKH